MSSLTFFFILTILAFILLTNNIQYPAKSQEFVKINLQSSSTLLTFIIFFILTKYLYFSIPPDVYKDVVFTTSYIISRITIDLQSNSLDPYQLDCIYRELLFHINCNNLYLELFFCNIQNLSFDSLEFTRAIDSYNLANKNLVDLYALLDNVKTHSSIDLNKIK